MPRQTIRDVQELATTLARKGLHMQANNMRQDAETLLAEARSLNAAATQQAVEQWARVQAGTEPTQVTLASSLAVAAQELGADRVPNELATSLIRPATDVALFSPFDRCSPEHAHEYAAQLADISIALLPQRRAEGLRLGLEAHYLFAIASRMQTPAMRYQMNGYGPPWARVLLACSRAYEAEGELSMALDLAAWGGGVAKNLLPFSALEPELRPLLHECVEQHGRLCIVTSDKREGEAILRQAKTLWDT
jgi:hypothetical protein